MFCAWTQIGGGAMVAEDLMGFISRQCDGGYVYEECGTKAGGEGGAWPAKRRGRAEIEKKSVFNINAAARAR